MGTTATCPGVAGRSSVRARPAALLALLVALLTLLAGCGTVDSAGQAPAAGTVPSEALDPTRPADATSPPTVGWRPAPTATPVAEPSRVVVASIGVDAGLMAVGLEPDGEMELPDPGMAAWYSEGPRPGAAGPSVIVAHVSSRRGPDVFHRLDELQVGAEIEVVRVDGTTGRWRVSGSEQVDKDDLPTERIWNRTDVPVLRLVTCGGTVQPDGHYDDNIIVYAEPVG